MDDNTRALVAAQITNGLIIQEEKDVLPMRANQAVALFRQVEQMLKDTEPAPPPPRKPTFGNR